MRVGQLRFGCVFLKLRSSRGGGAWGKLSTLLACFLYSWQTRSKQLMRFESDQRRRRNSRNQYSLTRSCKNRFWASQQRSDLFVCLFVFFFWFCVVLFCRSLNTPIKMPTFVFLFFLAFFPPPTKLSRIGWSSTMHVRVYVSKSSSFCCFPVDVP
jgi:hypothetical protein